MTTIDDLLNRGVDTVYPTKDALRKALESGKKLKLYQGFDPTGTDLHIGHMIGLRKLRQWQDLGHEVIFLIGDGTGQAGDPSGKLSSRETFFSRDELRENAKQYVMQASKIVRFEGENAIKIMYNGDWLNDLKLVDILNILEHFTLQQLSERDMFQERMKSGTPIKMREFIYPILQGYDSVAMEVDLEVGGSDQMFNMMCGRALLKSMKQKDKFVMTTPLLADSSGRKIGKTEGNVIGLTDKPSDLFGKIMSLGDDIIVKGFEYLTDVDLEEVKQIESALQNGANPIEFKKKLAFEIVQQLNSTEEARSAQEVFERVVQNKELPTEVEEVVINLQEFPYLNDDVLVHIGLTNSKSEAKRLFEQGGIEADGTKVTDSRNQFALGDGIIIKVGKRKVVKIKAQ